MVIAGVSNRFEVDFEQQVHIADVYEHPDFYFNGYYLLFDVALVQVAEPLAFTDRVRPVCLPDVDFEIEPGTYLTSTGFGETGAGTHNYSSPVLFMGVCVCVCGGGGGLDNIAPPPAPAPKKRKAPKSTPMYT